MYMSTQREIVREGERETESMSERQHPKIYLPSFLGSRIIGKFLIFLPALLKFSTLMFNIKIIN